MAYGFSKHKKNTWFGANLASSLWLRMIMISCGNNPSIILAGASCFHQFDCSCFISRLTSKCLDPFLLAQGGWVSIICVRHVGLSTVTRSATRQRYCWMPQTVLFSRAKKLWLRFQEKHDQLVNRRELFEPADLQDFNWQCKNRGHNSSSSKASAKSCVQK